MFDSTVVRAHVSAAGAKGGRRSGARPLAWRLLDENPSQGRSRLTGGEANDSRNFEILLDLGPDINPRAALGDKGYGSKSNRRP
jgi:hypothetical protein